MFIYLSTYPSIYPSIDPLSICLSTSNSRKIIGVGAAKITTLLGHESLNELHYHAWLFIGSFEKYTSLNMFLRC